MQVYVPNPQKIRKVGNSLVITIPADVAEHHDLKPDDLVRLILEPVEQITIPRLAPDVQHAVDQVLKHDQEALRYLGGMSAPEEGSP